MKIVNKNNLFFYKKFLTFNFLFSFKKIKLYLNFHYFLKVFNFIYQSKRIKIFIPENFNINNDLYISFWKNGFISNFNVIKWCFLNILFIKKLPLILINLTNIKNIYKEIKIKNLPLINLMFNKSDFDDFFLINDIKIKNLDITYFYIILFNFIKKFKDV
jgi:hypothetical protein